MTREQLHERLKEEVDKYANELSYERAVALATPIVEQRGTVAPDSDDFYQVGVRMLETGTFEGRSYAHLAVSVDDGRGPGIGPLRVIKPEVASLIFRCDGRVEKVYGR